MTRTAHAIAPAAFRPDARSITVDLRLTLSVRAL